MYISTPILYWKLARASIPRVSPARNYPAKCNRTSVAAPVGALTVGSVLSVALPDSANAERWQWERSDDGSTDWTDVTPYRNCGQPDSEYPLTSDDEGKYLRAYVYYNDDSSGSIVLKRAQSAASGPVPP